MRDILLKEVRIVMPGHRDHGQLADIRIRNGMIRETGTGLKSEEGEEVFHVQGACVSPGWMDLRANFCDPGKEHREDLYSGAAAAAAGGYTSVALVPETDPRILNKAQIEYYRSRSRQLPVNIYPLAAISTTPDGDTISEMYDLVQAGAAGFSSGYKPVADHGFLLRALLYGKNLARPVMVRAENRSIAGKGLVHEGIVSTRIGMKGIPSMAEEVDVHVLLELARYTGAAIHLSCLSSAGSIRMVEAAVAEGLPVTADVSVQHLSFCEHDLEGFDTNLKLRPPLRSEQDREYLRRAVLKHDFIHVVTDHNPQEDDQKRCEFELAGYGAIGLQTAFSQLLHAYGPENLDAIIHILAVRPRQLMGIGLPGLEAGEQAELTIFHPDEEWTLDAASNRSRSRNTPLWGVALKGRALGIINGGKSVLTL